MKSLFAILLLSVTTSMASASSSQVDYYVCRAVVDGAYTMKNLNHGDLVPKPDQESLAVGFDATLPMLGQVVKFVSPSLDIALSARNAYVKKAREDGVVTAKKVGSGKEACSIISYTLVD